MHSQSVPARFPPDVTMAFWHIEAGVHRLSRAAHHRIMVHASAATRSYCNEVGRYFVRRAGDIDLVPAGQEGGFETETPFDTIEIALQPALMERVAAELGGKARALPLDTRHLLRDQRIQHLARALESDLGANSPSGSLFADSIGAALAVRLLGLENSDVERTNRLSDAQLKRVLEHIEAGLHEPLSIQRLSRVAGASSSHLRAWFKAATGVTLHRYVVRRRVERARALLQRGDLSTSKVAELTGFAHQSHLAHWMRREIGQTPRDLRRAQPK
ncbi:AraC family transcriptional regulator [Mesorhizobium sp. M7A.F.Ca.CA.001.07.2.1]|uniref:AraC family transcriptional regulator n=5 Tax=Phyllobacteriaceae TaxID=69277 RepID=UPI000FCB7A3F|nr:MULTISPECIES: AraC family transcriptional regulator [Mesorhizobium]MCF6127433.1 AraC family transcriptional regulator [Mesorhizobium ciceri]MCQ8817556.1 AraC family transcriptional regulator [Mesorhizobium sp. SEMIA396]RUX75461.1 AraC family transcriptional regulator [Mesorhizobium sp. M7A.F.Ca.CA.004.08.2.1]RUY05765.1 AraC family transcriptional regulator [Mesorhizobium sp. M7A.F.Ca.CA.004.04.1.1]RUY13542.1 AraC family transcriptional regulator [Mesorhizobium sp. M7A.F.Ca.CA.004.12.1.1]